MKEPTPQAIKLHEAFRKRKIKSELEKWDGHKHIDIAITWARLNIEIDGKHHFTNSEQILRDLERGYWSNEKGYDTIHVPNEYIDKHVEEIANAIAKVCRLRYEEINEDYE